MSSFNAFQTFAEVSATLVGLIAVIVVLRGRSERAWSVSERYGAIHVLLPGLMALLSSLVPIILFTSYGETVTVWRVAHFISALIHLIGPITFWTRPKANRAFFDTVTAAPLGIVSILIIATNFAIAAGYLVDHATIVYFFGLFWMIIVSIFTFGSMLLASSQDD
jgi:hypothetical protein